MATNFMAASGMKILRLFVNNELDGLINWVRVSDTETDSGSSTFTELVQFEDVQLEVYLNANCCSIFKANVAGISTKRLTEELVLGIIEDNLADDIDLVKPIILHVEDDTAYVAVFNRDFYEDLVSKLSALNRPIRFLQSFVYTTMYNEDGWTLYLSPEQNFIRVSKYEYYLLDDNQPLPLLLQDMLTNEKPNSILVYTDKEHGLTQLAELGVETTLVEDELEFGIQIWNFYNQKSTKFKINLTDSTKRSLMQLLKTSKYFAIVVVIFWLLNVVTLSFDNMRTRAQLKTQLNSVLPGTTLNKGTLKAAQEKLTELYHARGIYDSEDAVPLFQIFLDVVSDISTNDITQINYSGNQLQVFLTNNFNPSQFGSYKNIFSTKRINARIEDYKSYAKANKTSQSQYGDDANEGIDKQPQISDDTAWVITLAPSWVQPTNHESK